MRNAETVLARILSPFPVSQFLTQCREKRTLYVRGNGPDKFKDILSIEAIDSIISSGYLRHPECKLAKEGREIPLSRYLVADTDIGQIDIDALYSEYEKGASIVLNYAHRYWPPLSRLCGELERELSMPVQANIYFTPRISQGFSIHYDPHDVFILQVSGTKRWRLYGSPITLPDDKQQFNSSIIEIGDVEQRCTLRAGDLLYIPRGHLHEAVADRSPSLHITVGIRPVTFGDLLTEAVGILARSDPELRTSLPAGYDDPGQAGTSLTRKLMRIRSKVIAGLPLEEAVEELADRFVSRQHQALEGHLVDSLRAVRLTLDSAIERRKELFVRRWRHGGYIQLLVFRKKLLLPTFVDSSLKFILRVSTFRPRDIPGRISNKSRLVLCRRLIEEGLLRIISE
jgi:ribosomal protein L16 Arg81 hydroxylase